MQRASLLSLSAVAFALVALGQTAASSQPLDRMTAAQQEQVRLDINEAIAQQVEPHWRPPTGRRANEIVSVVVWDLAPDGTLKDEPRVIRQSGVYAANRASAQLHADNAIRAVKAAAPFALPQDYYPLWARVTFRFDQRIP